MKSMTTESLLKRIDGHLLTEKDTLSNTFSGLYVGDLLSNVINHLNENDLFITINNNINSLAVAYKRKAQVIVYCENIEIDNEIITKANQLKIALVKSPFTAAEVIKSIILQTF